MLHVKVNLNSPCTQVSKQTSKAIHPGFEKRRSKTETGVPVVSCKDSFASCAYISTSHVPIFFTKNGENRLDYL